MHARVRRFVFPNFKDASVISLLYYLYEQTQKAREAQAREARWQESVATASIKAMTALPYFIVITAACAGFFIALHIRRKKQTGGRFVCPIGFDCDAVVRSKYSRIMGVPVEIGGMFYYALIAVAYALFYFTPAFLSPALLLAVLITSFGAVLFSLYLTGVQMFSLKEWCTWCLASAGMCAAIFVGALWIALS